MSTLLLVVEDSDEDYQAIVRALGTIAPEAVVVSRAIDGDAALEALHESHNGSVPLPNVVILDLNLPGTDGRTVLDEIKLTRRLKQLPIVIISSSTDAQVIEDCYRRGASGYIVKPMEYSKLEELLRALKSYWLDSVELPVVSSEEKVT